MVDPGQIKGSPIHIDGFNLLILAEVLLSGGIIFECLDGTFRDIASIHGSYHPVEETKKAIISIGKSIESLGPASITWYLDTPVSNSGRLKKLISETGEHQGWKWEVRLAPDPDLLLIDIDGIVISSDRDILSRCKQWFNFSKYFIAREGINNQYLITLKNLGLTTDAFKF
jgi:hypothetical protein